MHSGDFRYVYGPVPSRRLGRSLGIDAVPLKTCTYDCIYCQLGRTTTQTLTRQAYTPVGQALMELDYALSERPAPDYVTISGSGEPTLNLAIASLISGAKRRIRKPVAVLSNSSLLGDAAVRRDLVEADVVMTTLGAAQPPLFAYIHRPYPGLSFEGIVEGIAAFRREFGGQIWIEILLLAGITGTFQEAEKLAVLAQKLGADRVHLGTISRPPAEEYACPVPKALLGQISQSLQGRVSAIDSWKPGDCTQSASSAARIGPLLKRRPCTIKDITAALSIKTGDAADGLMELLRRGEVVIRPLGEERFYVWKSPLAARTGGNRKSQA